MMHAFHRRSLLAVTASIVAASLIACDPGFEDTGDDGSGSGGGGGGDDGGGEVTSQEYVAPDNWRLALEDDADFELEERSEPVGGTLSSVARGDYEELSSGFSLLTVAANGVTGDAPAANSELGALAVEDDLLLIRNWNTGAPSLVPFIASANCPNSLFAGNWIQLTRPTSDLSNSTTSAFFGDVYFNFTDLTMDSENRFALTPEFPEQEVLEAVDTEECESGVIESDAMTVYFGESGTALIHRDIGTAEESLWLALPQDPLSADDLDGTYAGYWIDYGRSLNDQVWLTTMECASFACDVQRITDIADTSNLANQAFDIELDDEALDEPINGFITGTSTIREGSFNDQRPLACVASDNFNDTGDKVLICVGQSPSSNGATVNGFFVAAD